MNLFDTLCENIFLEMGAPGRGLVGRPKEVLSEPEFAKKEKFGTQAGKYSGSQMLNILGDFLKNHGDTATSYEELGRDLNRYLVSVQGFRGTAARYWTRSLSDAIFKFNHKVETAAEAPAAPETPQETESTPDAEPENSTEPDTEETPARSTPSEPLSSSDYLSDKVYEYLKDGDESSEEIAKFLSRSEVKMAVDKANQGNNILTAADKEKIVSDVISKKQKEVEKSLESLSKQGKVEKTDDGKYKALVEEPAEGEGTGEVSTLTGDDEEEDVRDFSRDDIGRYTGGFGPEKEDNMWEDSVDFKSIFTSSFKNIGLIKE